jgi:hypothetical protein
MAKLRDLDSAVRKDSSLCAVAASSPESPFCTDTVKYCAYNKTKERFLCAELEAADFSIASLNDRLPTLALNSGAGLWLIPFRGISPTSMRVPVDLIYLDRNCVVVETVESFPISGISASSPPAASVLVVPPETIRSIETQPGDQLILCSPDEMKHRLKRLANSRVDGKPEQTAASVKQWPVRKGTLHLLEREGRSSLKNPAEKVPAVDRTHKELRNEPTPTFPDSHETSAIEPAQKSLKPAKSWLKRLLYPDPPDPRKASREPLPGLVTYFFTGGSPVAHGVRDISLTGIYVFTTERWYLGTVVRMTLTDQLKPNVERSITLNATVVRWGNDGVGLKFILRNSNSRGQEQANGMPEGVDKMQIDSFVQRLRSAGG